MFIIITSAKYLGADFTPPAPALSLFGKEEWNKGAEIRRERNVIRAESLALANMAAVW